VVVRDDGIPDFERPLARSNLVISDSDGFGNVTTYIAPEGSASEYEGESELGELKGELTQRRTVAKGDRIVFEIEADGITGLVSWLDDRIGSEGIDIPHTMLSKLLSFPDGVVFDAEQTNPGPNEPVTTLDIDGANDGQLYVLHEPVTETGDQRAIEQYYVVLDTRDTGPFDREIEPGDQYRFQFGYSATGETDWFHTVDHDSLAPNGADPHFPYYDADAGNHTETRLVTVEERTVEYDRTDSRDRPILETVEGETLSGRTNLAPGTEGISIRLTAYDRVDTPQYTTEEVTIGPNGTFSVSHDLSDLEPGESLDVKFYLEGKLFDKREVVLVDEDAESTHYAITDHTESAIVTRGESLSDVSVTIENTGYLPDRQLVKFSLEGETADAKQVELNEEGWRTVEFDTTIDAEPGPYNYTIETDDEEVTGLLVVEENETDVENQTASESGAPSETVSESDDPDESAAEADGSDRSAGDSSPDEADESTAETPKNGETEDDEESPDENPEDSLLAPIGGLLGSIGTRHAIGGAVVVGSVHVLGFWG
ncbi:MAG: BGTF surface domain-containing protein, partial [Natronomonas sp.]